MTANVGTAMIIPTKPISPPNSRMENSTQKLYRLYNRICAKAEPDNKTVTDILTQKKLT